MATSWRRIVLGASIGLYFLGLGFVGGMAWERIQFDRHRTALVSTLQRQADRLHAHLMVFEGAQADTSAPAPRADTP
jgi:hypothetical protein